MQARWRSSISIIVAALLALTPAYASIGPGGGFTIMNRPYPPLGQSKAGAIDYTRGTCTSDTADATTYSGGVWDTVSTGATDTDVGWLVIGIISKDAATTFNVTGVTVDGSATGYVEQTDNAGSVLVSAAVYRSVATTGAIAGPGAAEVALAITFSEAITGAVACVWMIKNNAATGNNTNSNSNSTTDSTPTSTTVAAGVAGGVEIAIAGNESTGVSTTWGGTMGIIERQDTCNAEFCYSTADLMPTVGGSTTVTSDYTGSGDAVHVSTGTMN